MVLAGAGGALVLLSPRVEQLEARCSQGDLSVQVTVPGFTDALVSRVGEADLVPQFASALVSQVKDSGLVGHAVDAAMGRVGQAVSSALCPWKWRLGQQQQQQEK
ncbi:hypothetical protein OEZ86_009461 [Tetradesmus obliquus]|nr:hypothetical protein OEZ86_009461 [Tetradesmus obliquus]